MERQDNTTKTGIILIGNSTFTFKEDNEDVVVNHNDEKALGSNSSSSCGSSTSSVSGNGSNASLINDLLSSNLTIYLNDSTTLSKVPRTKPLNEVRRDGELPEWKNIDVENYEFFSHEERISSGGGGFTLNQSTVSTKNDVPEFIDVECLVAERSTADLFVDGSARRLEIEVADDGDEVIFVKEYHSEEARTREGKKLEPRRNPKRQVTSKRSINTGAVFSPPTPLSDSDFKIWPVDGMHEKPLFNPITKRLEKLPNVTCRKPARKRPAIKRKASKEEENHINNEFAQMTHRTIHGLLSYMAAIDEYNRFSGVATSDEAPNMKLAKSILMDSCILYAFANDVSQESLAKYLDNLAKREDQFNFLKGLADECNATTSKSKK